MIIPLIHNLYCWAWDRVYIKANGRVACYCSAGETHTIIHPNNYDNIDFIVDVVNSQQMREMRLSVLENRPYIMQCHSCCCFQKQGKPKDKRYSDSEIADNVIKQASQAYNKIEEIAHRKYWPRGSIDFIDELQLEPSFPCNLKCPSCLHGWHDNPLDTESAPHIFPLSWLKSIVDSIKKHDIKLNRISFVGRGEPTLSKHLPDMINYICDNLPDTLIGMDTNSTQLCKPEYLKMGWINCSIDGSTNDSYNSYRRGGDFESTIDFMKQAVKYKNQLNSNCKIRWKYILFNTTESELLLDLAQKIANEIGIDELDFVITACGAHDGSITPPKIMNTIEIVRSYLKRRNIFKNTMTSRS